MLNDRTQEKIQLAAERVADAALAFMNTMTKLKLNMGDLVALHACILRGDNPKEASLKCNKVMERF